MRKVFSVALMAAVIGLVGMTKDAGAAVTITLSWGACGGGGCTAVGTATGSTIVDAITVDGAGQTLRLDIFLSSDELVSAHGISIAFDTDLLNELNITSAPLEWTGTDVNPGPLGNFYAPAAPIGGTSVQSTFESTGVVGGRFNWFESNGSGFAIEDSLPASNSVYSIGSFTGTAPAFYRIGRAFFTTTAGVMNDGNDVFSGFFATGFDGMNNSVGGFITNLTFNSASVNVIPEPGTVSLLGLGLVGLVLAGRRSRRS